MQRASLYDVECVLLVQLQEMEHRPRSACGSGRCCCLCCASARFRRSGLLLSSCFLSRSTSKRCGSAKLVKSAARRAQKAKLLTSRIISTVVCRFSCCRNTVSCSCSRFLVRNSTFSWYIRVASAVDWQSGYLQRHWRKHRCGIIESAVHVHV